MRIYVTVSDNNLTYICTKQINFLHITSEGHFETPSLSWYSFSDPQNDLSGSPLYRLYGFKTWQPYAKIGCIKVLHAIETPSELMAPKVRLIKPRTLLALAKIYQGACGDLQPIRVCKTTILMIWILGSR